MAPPVKSPASKKGGGIWIPETCTTADLCVMFDVGRRTIQDLATRGILVKTDGGRGFMTIPSIHGYTEHLRKKAAGRASEGESLADERVKSERVKRALDEMKLAEAQGRSLPVEEAEVRWSAWAASVKAAFLSMPSTLRSKIPHLTTHDAQTIQQVARDKLRDLSEEAEATITGVDWEAVKDE